MADGAVSAATRRAEPVEDPEFETTLGSALFSDPVRLGPGATLDELLFAPNLAPGPVANKDSVRAGRLRSAGTKTRTVPVATAISEHYQRRRTSLEEAILEIYHADLSIKRAEDLTELLWGKRVSLGRISELAREVSARIEQSLREPLLAHYPYVFVEGTPLRRGSGNEAVTPSILIAIGVNAEGRRELLSVGEGSVEDTSATEAFWQALKARGLKGTRLIVGERCAALMAPATKVFPEAAYQACVSQFCDHAISLTSGADLFHVTELLQRIHDCADAHTARATATEVRGELREIGLEAVAEFVEEAVESTLPFYDFPKAHWTSIRSNESLRRIVREIRERARVVGAFYDGRSAVVMATARLRQIARKSWVRYQYLRSALETSPARARVA